jgi:parvulin-like peptidyl-prolyl isomerase
MIALNRGRTVALGLVAAATLGTIGTSSAQAQTQQKPGRASTTAQVPAPPGEGPRLQEVRVPTNTTDPIAIVNGEVITRQQLADECVARKGQEILETLIARRLIEQAMRGSNLEITADEINAEIDSIAWTTAKADREKWLRILEKERGISPAMYVRDIVYPALALKKLAAKRVQVTEKDIKEAFEANFGERLRCRMIMVENVRTANEVWSELQKNPDGFERLAKTRSTDNGSKANGGLLPEPIARYANPRDVSKAVFAQLVDGNPGDKDSKGNPIKPKDGAFTGPIQLHEAAWLIIKREELLPAKSGAKINDPSIQALLKEQMYEVKQNEAVASLFEDLMRVSTIDNKLTGQVKSANEEQDPEYKKGMTDSGVNRTATQGQPPLTMKTNGRAPVKINTSPAGTPVTPAGVPSGAASATGQLQNTIKTAPPGTSTPPGN